jgi:hypothetical protein
VLSDSSRDPAAGETAAKSRMEQSVDVGGALLQLVRGDTDFRPDRAGCRCWLGAKRHPGDLFHYPGRAGLRTGGTRHSTGLSDVVRTGCPHGPGREHLVS